MDQAMTAVGELIRAQKLRIEVTPTIGYDVKAPCLLAQLRDAILLGTEGGGRGVPASRPNVAIDALDLWVWVTHDTHAWADALSIARRDPGDRHTIPWVGRLLRSVAATAGSTGRLEIAERVAFNAGTWARQILAMLTGKAEQRGVRGAECPQCRATGIVETRVEERREQRYRVPAIVLVTQSFTGTDDIRWLTCLSCGWYEPFTVTGVTLAHTSTSLDVPIFEAA